MLMTDKQYDVLAKIGRLILPITTLLTAIATIWGLPLMDKVTATLTALGVFLNAFLSVSAAKYNEAKRDGGVEE